MGPQINWLITLPLGLGIFAYFAAFLLNLEIYFAPIFGPFLTCFQSLYFVSKRHNLRHILANFRLILGPFKACEFMEFMACFRPI